METLEQIRMINHHYRNGYNDCSDQVVKVINKLLSSSYTSSISMQDVLMEIKQTILEEAF